MLKHQLRLLPSAGRVCPINNNIVEVDNNGNVPAIYDGTYCALEVRRGIRQPKL